MENEIYKNYLKKISEIIKERPKKHKMKQRINGASMGFNNSTSDIETKKRMRETGQYLMRIM